MSLDLALVSQIIYLREGEVNPGDEEKVIRYKKKMSDWKRDLVDGISTKMPPREEMLLDLFQLENSFNGYWCEGEKCGCSRTHWVVHTSKSNWWDCMHNDCACSPPLVWDDLEQTYYRFFLSCDGKKKKNVWMPEPIGNMASTINYKWGEKERKERSEKEREEENCAENQQSANYGYCCHQHAKVAKTEHEKRMKQMKKQKDEVNKLVDGPDHCIHCDEDPSCVFIQIESYLCENDEIHYDADDYGKDEQRTNN
jgi:hypothetical protein